MAVTLITGANKGIGFEVASQLTALGHTVYLGARDTERGTHAAAEIGCKFVQLDVTDDHSVAAAIASITSNEAALDVLVHNAGILETSMDAAAAQRTFDTNVVGIVRVTEAALPLLVSSSEARVVTLSSSLGSFWAVTNPDRPEHGFPLALYAASKAAATMLTVQFAKIHPSITFTAVEPGTTATDMTAAFAIGRPVRDSAAVVVDVATRTPHPKSGQLLDEHGVLQW